MAATVYVSGNVDGMVRRLEDGDASPHCVEGKWIETFVPMNPPGAVSEGPGVVKVLVNAHPQESQGAATSQPGPAIEGWVRGRESPSAAGWDYPDPPVPIGRR